MFGFRFIKAEPTTYVVHYRNGRVLRRGAGLSFIYFEPSSSIVLVPAKSSDVPYFFNEVTADFQDITIQGQFTYRIADALALSQLLDFSVDRHGRYRSDDSESLHERLTQVACVLLRDIVRNLPFEEALRLPDTAIAGVFERFAASPIVMKLGVEILDFTIVAIRPSPEMAKALEANTREALQRKADEAIYMRRNAAVDQERLIKENELRTEVSLEEKKRLVRETQMAADIAVEEKRSTLIGERVANDRKEAEARAFALEAVLKPLKDADWKTLTAAMSGDMRPELMIATAFREMAENAGRIGELNMTPELLSSLSKPKR